MPGRRSSCNHEVATAAAVANAASAVAGKRGGMQQQAAVAGGVRWLAGWLVDRLLACLLRL